MGSNDYNRLVKLQAKRAKMKAALDVLDDQIRTLAEPMRAVLKLPGRAPGRPRGSEGMDRVVTFIREIGPAAVGEIGDRLGLKRTQIYKLVDRLKEKGAIRANEQGRYELVPGYEAGAEENGVPSAGGHPPTRNQP